MVFGFVVLIHRYLAREVGKTLLVVAPALCLLVALLQAMRLLPLVAAAELGPRDVATVSLALLVPLSAIALPAAMVVTLLVVLARLEADGELTALRASGASERRLAAAPAALCLGVALCAGALTLFAEPVAARTLHGRLGAMLVRSALGQVREGILAEPTPGLTMYARRREGPLVEGLFLDDRREAPPTLVFARVARLEPAGERAAVRLRLDDGEIHGRTMDGRRVRAGFRRLETELPLPDATSILATVAPRRLGRDPWQLARDARGGGADARRAALLLHRRLALAPGALALGLLTLLIGLGGRVVARPWALALGAGLVLAYHLTARLGEALVARDVLGPAGGGWAPALLCWAAVGVALLSSSLAGVCSRVRKRKRRG